MANANDIYQAKHGANQISEPAPLQYNKQNCIVFFHVANCKYY